MTATTPQAAIKLHFYASHVYMVADSDVKDGILTVIHQRLYEMMDFSKAVEGEMTLIINTPGVAALYFYFWIKKLVS